MSKILVAEDEEHIRKMLVDLLFYEGYDVIEAADGGAALEMACSEQPDLILLDVMMPVMDGFQVLEKLKNDLSTQSIPVIMVTAKGQERDELQARATGAWDYITKPWEPGEVESKVMNAEIETRRR